MKHKEKFILTLIVLCLAVAGLTHATVRFFMLKGNIYYTIPETVAFLWLLPYALAIAVCLLVGGIVIHRKKKNKFDNAANK